MDLENHRWEAVTTTKKGPRNAVVAAIVQQQGCESCDAHNHSE